MAFYFGNAFRAKWLFAKKTMGSGRAAWADVMQWQASSDPLLDACVRRETIDRGTNYRRGYEVGATPALIYIDCFGGHSYKEALARRS